MIQRRPIIIEQKNNTWHRLLGLFYEIHAPGVDLPDGLLDFYDVVKADGLAKDMADELYNDYLAVRDCRPELNAAVDHKNGHLMLKKYILTETKNLVLSLIFGQKAARLIGAGEPARFIPKFYVAELSAILERKAVLPSGPYIIPYWFKTIKKIEQIAKIIINTILIYMYPLIMAGKSLSQRSAIELKNAYKYGIYLRATDSGITDKPNSMDFMIKQGLIEASETLFVIDSPLGAREAPYLSALAANGYESCLFSRLEKTLRVREYFGKIYPQLRAMRRHMLASFPVQYYYTRVCMNTLQNAYRWETFYCRTKVGTFFSRQEPGGISRALLQKRHGSVNVFQYLSSTHHENSAVKTYYTLMAVDKFVSSKIPVEEFRTLDNYIDDYCDIGVINADLVRRLKADAGAIAKIKGKNRIPDGSRAITVFDDNSDTYSTYSAKNMRYYLQMVISMVNRYEDIYFFYKPRVTSVFARDDELKVLFNTLVSHPRCRLILPDNPDFTAIDLMAASDLVLTVYTSSTLTEALASGIMAVCYKPEDAYEDHFWERIENMPYVCAHNQKELETDLDYWLLADREHEFAELMEKHIKPKIDGFCDGRALERLKNIL